MIFEDELSKDISSGKLCGVYFIFGEDAYLKNYYADKIINKSYDGAPFFNLQKFEENADLQEVYDAVNQFPMMSDTKCVVLSDYDFEGCSQKEFERICALPDECVEGCTLIFKFDSVYVDEKRSAKAKKLISAVEKAEGCIVKLDHRSASRLYKMLMDGAKKRNCSLSEVCARHLVENVGEDIYILKNELDKLCSFVNGGIIDKETIDLVCSKSVESSVYDYIKEILAQNTSGAMKLLDDMFYMHIEPMTILYNASSAYVDMYRMLCAKRDGVNSGAVAKYFNYKNKAFLLDKALNNLRKFDDKKLSLSFEALLKADSELKGFTKDPRTVLEQLTVRLIYIISKGESVD